MKLFLYKQLLLNQPFVALASRAQTKTKKEQKMSKSYLLEMFTNQLISIEFFFVLMEFLSGHIFPEEEFLSGTEQMHPHHQISIRIMNRFNSLDVIVMKIELERRTFHT